jgi:gas vesicle protein
MGKGFGKFLAGAAIGAGLGILFAPKKGSETRQELKAKLDELIEKVKNIDFDDVREDIEDKINDIKKELTDLDKEKVIKIAKKKSREILKKADELVKLAVEKGTPVVQKIASEAKEKTVEVLEDIIFKLEKEKTTK